MSLESRTIEKDPKSIPIGEVVPHLGRSSNALDYLLGEKVKISGIKHDLVGSLTTFIMKNLSVF